MCDPSGLQAGRTDDVPSAVTCRMGPAANATCTLSSALITAATHNRKIFIDLGAIDGRTIDGPTELTRTSLAPLGSSAESGLVRCRLCRRSSSSDAPPCGFAPL